MVPVIRYSLLLGKDPTLVDGLELYPLGVYPLAYGLCVYGHGEEGAEVVKQRTAMVQTPDRESWDEPSTT